MTCAFFDEKVHSLSVAPESLAIWNKKLEGLESELFKELKSSPVVVSEHLSGLFKKELGCVVLAYSMVVCYCQTLGLLLPDVESATFQRWLYGGC